MRKALALELVISVDQQNQEGAAQGSICLYVSIWALIHFSDGSLSSNQTVVGSIKIRTFWESLFINDQSLFTWFLLIKINVTFPSTAPIV